MSTLVWRKVPCAKYSRFLLFLFAYRWVHSCAAPRRPGSRRGPKKWLCYFCTFPHIISQGLREFKCDLLGNDKSLSPWCLPDEIIYTSCFPIVHSASPQRNSITSMESRFPERTGFCSSALKNGYFHHVAIKFMVLMRWPIKICVF